MDEHQYITEGWISIRDATPIRSMFVEWMCTDGVKDIGYYYADSASFASWDLCSTREITHWKPVKRQDNGIKMDI